MSTTRANSLSTAWRRRSRWQWVVALFMFLAALSPGAALRAVSETDGEIESSSEEEEQQPEESALEADVALDQRRVGPATLQRGATTGWLRRSTARLLGSRFISGHRLASGHLAPLRC